MLTLLLNSEFLKKFKVTQKCCISGKLSNSFRGKVLAKARICVLQYLVRRSRRASRWEGWRSLSSWLRLCSESGLWALCCSPPDCFSSWGQALFKAPVLQSTHARGHADNNCFAFFRDAVSLSPRLLLYLQRPFSQKWAGEGLHSASCSLLHVEQRKSCKLDFNLFKVLDCYACWNALIY